VLHHSPPQIGGLPEDFGDDDIALGPCIFMFDDSAALVRCRRLQDLLVLGQNNEEWLKN